MGFYIKMNTFKGFNILSDNLERFECFRFSKSGFEAKYHFNFPDSNDISKVMSNQEIKFS